MLLNNSVCSYLDIHPEIKSTGQNLIEDLSSLAGFLADEEWFMAFREHSSFQGLKTKGIKSFCSVEDS